MAFLAFQILNLVGTKFIIAIKVESPDIEKEDLFGPFLNWPGFFPGPFVPWIGLLRSEVDMKNKQVQALTIPLSWYLIDLMNLIISIYKVRNFKTIHKNYGLDFWEYCEEMNPNKRKNLCLNDVLSMNSPIIFPFDIFLTEWKVIYY